MLKCLICGKQTLKGEPTGKLFTKMKIKYPNDVIGCRIIKEIPCCIECSGTEWVEEEKAIDTEHLTHEDLTNLLSHRVCFKCGKKLDNEPEGVRCCSKCKKTGKKDDD